MEMQGATDLGPSDISSVILMSAPSDSQRLFASLASLLTATGVTQTMPARVLQGPTSKQTLPPPVLMPAGNCRSTPGSQWSEEEVTVLLPLPMTLQGRLLQNSLIT